MNGGELVRTEQLFTVTGRVTSNWMVLSSKCEDWSDNNLHDFSRDSERVAGKRKEAVWSS